MNKAFTRMMESTSLKNNLIALFQILLLTCVIQAVQAAEATTPAVDIVLEVSQDGGIEGGFSSADPDVDGNGGHTPGLDGPSSDGSIPAEHNNVVRTFDAIRYAVHWSINDVDSAATNNGTDGVITNLTITLDTGREDVRWIYMPEVCEGNSAITSGSAGEDTLLICELGTRTEGTIGTISPVAKVYAKTSGEASNDDIITLTASIDTDQTDPKDSNEVSTTISAKPVGNWIKGDPEYAFHVDNNGTDGVVFIYPIVFVPGDESGRIGTDPLDDSFTFDFYDHAWDLGDNAVFATDTMMQAIGRSQCGGYDGKGSYPYGDDGSLPAEATAENTTHSFTVTCTDETGQGSSGTNGNYPLVHLQVSDYSSREYPEKNADGTLNKARTIALQVAFWVPNSEIEDRLTQDPPPPFWNTINSDDSLDSSGADQEEDLVPNTEPIMIGVAGLSQGIEESTIGDNSASDPLLVIDDPLTTSGDGGGGSVDPRESYKQHAIIFPGPYQQVYAKDPDTGLDYVGLDYRLQDKEGLGMLSIPFWVGTSGVSRSQVVTLEYGVFATTYDPDSLTSDPIHLCGAIDNQHLDIVNLPATYDRYEVANAITDKGDSTIATSTGTPTDGIANVIFGDRTYRINPFEVNKDKLFTLRTNPQTVPAYVVEVTDAPLVINHDEHQLTCSDGDAGPSGWIDTRDTSALAALSSDTTPDANGYVHYDKITRVRVRMLEHRFWHNDSDSPDFFNGIGYMLHMQARIRPSITDDPDGEEIYVHSSRARGDWDAAAGNAPLNTDCTKRDFTNSATYAFNDGITSTGWCNLPYDTANEEDYADLLTALDVNAFERYSLRDVDGDGFNEVDRIFLSHSDKVTIVGSKLQVAKKLLDPIDTLLKDGDLATFKITAQIVGSPDDDMAYVSLADRLPANMEFVSATTPVDQDGNPVDGYVNCYYKDNWRQYICSFTRNYNSSAPEDNQDYRHAPFYAQFDITLQVTDPHANDILFNRVEAKAKRIENGEVSSSWTTTNAYASVPIVPRYNQLLVRKDVPDLDGPCVNDPGASAVNDNTLLAGDCSMFSKNALYSYDLLYTNKGNDYLSNTTLIDVLPFAGDDSESGDGDGRTPASSFTGTSILQSITASNTNAIIECTTDAPETIDRDPEQNSNTWNSTCDENATGFRIIDTTPLDVGESRSVHVELQTENNSQSDIYTNTFGTRVDEIALPSRANDVSAMVQTLSLGSTIFYDDNNNGLQDGTETGIANITVQLFKSGDDPTTATPIATMVTDANGDFIFTDLPAGAYFVYIPTPPADAPLSSTDVATTATDNQIDGDDNGIQAGGLGTPVRSPDITLSIGDEPTTAETDQGGNTTGDNLDDDVPGSNAAADANGDMTVDFGFTRTDYGDAPDTYGTTNGNNGAYHRINPTLHLGDNIDAEGNGVPSNDATGDDTAGDDDEDGVDIAAQNVLSVADSNGAATTTYTLSNISVTNETGTDAILVAYIDFNGDGNFDDAGETSDPVTIPSATGSQTISSVLFHDIAAINTGDTAVRLRLTTDAAAASSPTGPAPDGEVEDYMITILPVVRAQKVLVTSADTDTFDLFAGTEQANDVGNGGATDYVPFVIGATDSNGGQVTIGETSADSNETYISAMTCTDENGTMIYEQDGAPLEAGESYQITSDLLIPQGSSKAQNTITCTITNTEITKVVFVKNDATPADSTDFNFDGELTGNTGNDTDYSAPFILDGELTDTDGDGHTNSTIFELSGLSDGESQQYDITETVPAGWQLTAIQCLDTADGETTPVVTNATADQLANGTINIDIQFGDTITCTFTNIELVSLGSQLWLDSDNDGVQDSTESPLQGATIKLLNSDGTEAVAADGTTPLTTTTDSNGEYFFNNLLPGDYVVAVDLSTVSPLPGSITDTATLVPSSVQQLDANNDLDTDSNIDIHSPLETDPSDQIFYSPVITLAAGTEPENETAVIGNATGQPGQIGQEDNNGNMTLDMGFINTLSLGSFIWDDANGNGKQDAGEAGLPGSVVTLLVEDPDNPGDFIPAVHQDGSTVETQTTGADGLYQFTLLPAGNYKVQVMPPSTYIPAPAQNSADDTIEDDSNLNLSATGLPAGTYESGIISLALGAEPEETGTQPGDTQDSLDDTAGNMTVDFGFYEPVAIGNTLFLDNGEGGGTINNGIQDGTEPGAAGVTVELYTDADELVISTTTDADGRYWFDALPEGDYYIKVPASQFSAGQPLEGYVSSAGADPSEDNDILENGVDEADPAGNGIRSNTFTLEYGTEATGEDQNGYPGTLPDASVNATADLGFYQPVAVGNLLFLDNGDGGGTAGNGIQDGTEPAVGAGVPVELRLDDTDALIATTSTDADGHYFFDNLLPGTYYVQVPAAAFATGGSLAAHLSSQGADASESDDSLENGIDDPDPATNGIRSNAFVLDPLAEPQGEDQSGYSGSLPDASVNATLDFGFYEPASLGDTVWFDADGNGIQDAGEDGISGVTVKLYDSTGAEVNVGPDGLLGTADDAPGGMVTNGSGNYLFSSLPPGDYVVEVVPPAGYVISPRNTGDDDAVDSDIGTDGRTGTISITSGEHDLTSDAGLYKLLSLGDLVFEDSNGDGVYTAGVDQVITGARVELLDAGGSVIATTATDGTGAYLFTALEPGDYSVRVTPPAGYQPTPLQTADPDNDINNDSNIDMSLQPPAGSYQSGAITLVAGEEPGNDGDTDTSTNRTVDFGFVKPASVGNYIWLDENSDGLQDAGEPGLANVTVQLKDAAGTVVATTTTDANGGYLFSDLLPGDYFIDIDENTLPAGMTQTPPATNVHGDFGNQDHSGDGYAVSLASGDENLSADFGYNYVPADDVNTNTGTSALGDRIWIDSDGDGVQDDNEAPVAGVVVSLFTDPDGDGVFDTPYTAQPTATTDAAGRYMFTGLPAGAYVVELTDSSSATHDILGTAYTQTGDPDHFGTDSSAAPAGTAGDNRTTAPVVLAPGDVFLNGDFGYQPTGAPLYNIGDWIWMDINGDGVQDSAEPGIAGVTVSLQDSNGNILATTTTDADGKYLFTDLPDGETFTVLVTDTDNVLDGLRPTFDNDSTTNGPDEKSELTLAGADDLDQDFGYAPPAIGSGAGAIGDTVFLDRDANGAPDTGEGLEGVTVRLLDADGTVVAVAVTDEQGRYLFAGLDDGDYTVVVETTTLPAGLANTVDPDGGNDSSSTVTIAGGNTDLDQDFGYVVADAADAGRIGNLLWNDKNADGEYNPDGLDGIAGTDDDELPIGGVTVALYRDLDGNGLVDPGEPLIATTTTTDALTVTSGDQGNYLFDNLPAGDYVVGVTDTAGQLNGYWHSEGTAATTDNSQPDTYPVTLGAGEENLTADFGYYVQAGSLGDRIWQDMDANGLFDPDTDKGIEGVSVHLDIVYPDGTTSTLTTVTDADGLYRFDNLLLDEDYNGIGTAYGNGGDEPSHTVYLDTTTIPQDLLSIYPTRGSNTDTTDIGGNVTDEDDQDKGSDNPVNDGAANLGEPGFPPMGGMDTTNDFGYFTPGSIGDTIWYDINNDGIADPGEALSGITVTLTPPADVDLGNGLGQPASVDTDSDGKYLFEGLPAGTYTVTVDENDLPDPLRNHNSVDPDGNNDSTSQVTLATDDQGKVEDNLDQDFAYFSPASIGDYVWDDSDGDGLQDATESGHQNIAVHLLDADGNPVDDPLHPGVPYVIRTDANGRYLFENLSPGTYQVQFDVPDGSVLTVSNSGDDQLDSDPDASGLVTTITVDAGDSDLTIDMGLVGPAIHLDKATNGDDADDAPGISINVGDTVTWTYVVTNTGNVTLTSITVTDDKIGTVSCPATTLAPGDSTTCTATGTAAAGQYENTGTVTAVSPDGSLVIASDPSHYIGMDPDGPAIDVQTLTNGEDADTVTGPVITVGDPVTWTYVVSNIGNTSLDNITVSDDQGITVICPQTFLDIGASMTCTATGIADAGQYENTGSVTGVDSQGTTVTDSDPSHYLGDDGTTPVSAVTIEKSTNGLDADTGSGPQIKVGKPVIWTYLVTNTGQVDLTDITVTDDRVDAAVIQCSDDGSTGNRIAQLAAGASVQCTAEGIAEEGAYENIGTVTATPPFGPDLIDTDPSHYLGSSFNWVLFMPAILSHCPPTPDFCYIVADVDNQGGIDAPLLKYTFRNNLYQLINRLGAPNVEAIVLSLDGSTLYGTDNGIVGIIDTTPGIANSFHPIDPTARDAGYGRGSLGLIRIADIDGLAFDPTDGTLYGSNRLGEGSDGSLDLLVKIDTSTGKIIRNAFGEGIDYRVIDSRSVGASDIDDLAIDSSGRLIAIAGNSSGGGNDHLITIDKRTAAVTDIGPLTNAVDGSAIQDMESLTFYNASTLFGTTGVEFMNSSANSLYRIDKNTGKTTPLIRLDQNFNGYIPGDFEAIDCFPTCR